MEYIREFMLIYLFLVCILWFLMYLIPKSRHHLGLNKGLRAIVNHYELNMDKRKIALLTKILILVNALIIDIPLCLAFWLPLNYIVMLIGAFILFVLLIYSSYNIIGSILKKKGW